MKIDLKDKKILSALNQEARLSIADISKKTGIQRDSIMYRLKRLKNNKIIRFYHCVLDPASLNHPIFTFVSISLKNNSIKREKQLITYLKAHDNVVYAAKTSGKWKMIINIAAKSLTHFNQILTQIQTEFDDIISDIESSSILEEYKYDNMIGLIHEDKRKGDKNDRKTKTR